MGKNPMIFHDVGKPSAVGQGGLIATLTPRQIDVIRVAATGASDKQTGLLLSISRETVRKHINNARLKLGVDNRIQLIVAFVQWQTMEGRE